MFRVYFSCRDEVNRSSVGYVLIDITEPQDTIEISSHPVMRTDDRGLFDESGT